MLGTLESLIQSSPVFAGALLILFLIILGYFSVVLFRAPANRRTEYPIPEVVAEGEETLDFMGHINRGNELLGDFNYDKALHHYQEAVKLKPGEAAVHFKIGRVFLQKEDYPSAISAFENVLSLNPKQIEAHFELARIRMLGGNLKQAHQHIDEALRLQPDHEDSLKFKVKLLEGEERYQEALPVVRSLMDLHGPRMGARYRHTYADFLAKLDRYEEAISEYEALLGFDPENELMYRGKIGQAYFEMGNYTKAIEYFKAVLQRQEYLHDPDLLLAMRTRMAAALCNEGVRYFQASDVPSAVQRYEEALSYDGFNPDIHFNLGQAYARQKEAALAMAHYQKAIELAPDDAASYYELAVLQDEKGMVSEAIMNYEKVLALEPGHLKATFGLGTLYGVQGDMSRAIQYLSEAVRLNPQYVDAIYNLGVALEKQNQTNKAVQMYKKVLDLDPAHEKAASNLAHIQHMKSQGIL